MLEDEEVDVLKEIDVWLGNLEAEITITSPCVSVSTGSTYSLIQGRALRKAREVAAKCQHFLRSKEQDGRTRKSAREIRDYHSDKDNALATDASLLEKAKKVEE